MARSIPNSPAEKVERFSTFSARVTFACCPTERVKHLCGSGPIVEKDANAKSKSKRRSSGLNLASVSCVAHWKLWTANNDSFGQSRPTAVRAMAQSLSRTTRAHLVALLSPRPQTHLRPLHQQPHGGHCRPHLRSLNGLAMLKTVGEKHGRYCVSMGCSRCPQALHCRINCGLRVQPNRQGTANHLLPLLHTTAPLLTVAKTSLPERSSGARARSTW